MKLYFFKEIMDWRRVLHETHDNTLYQYLLSIPQSQWSERDPDDNETLLHYAVRYDNRKAVTLLIKNGIDINATCSRGTTALLIAVVWGTTATVEILCTLGAAMVVETHPLLINNYHFIRDDSFHILIANGMRMCLSGNRFAKFQRGILKARSAVVALLKLYKSYRTRLNRIGCKYMMQELVVAVWATRRDENWQ